MSNNPVNIFGIFPPAKKGEVHFMADGNHMVVTDTDVIPVYFTAIIHSKNKVGIHDCEFSTHNFSENGVKQEFVHWINCKNKGN